MKTSTAPAAPAAAPAKKSAAGYDLTKPGESEIKTLAEKLTPEERKVILNQGTEPPFCGTLLDNHKNGTYVCRLCGLPLFKSSAKFNSGTGWPSFYEPYDKDHIADLRDTSHGMVRVENRCARCDAHLGHVFEDGPPPTGKRYCLNSVSLDFVEEGKELPSKVKADQTPAKR